MGVVVFNPPTPPPEFLVGYEVGYAHVIKFILSAKTSGYKYMGGMM